MTRYWKITNADGSACHGGDFRYDLPKHGKPGKWTPRIKNPIKCESGYHVVTDAGLVNWCNGERIWMAEARGVVVTPDDEGKIVAESVRLVAPTPWDEVTARLFAVECAADVLHLTDDPRVAECLEVAHRYACGDATVVELVAAADAARYAADAARYAAGAAAGAAPWAAARAVRYAAGAPWAAAGAARAAGDAAWNAAGAALRAKQTARLLWWIGAANTYPEAQ